MNKTILEVSHRIETLRFNTAISALMVFLNALGNTSKPIPQGAYEILLKLLAPFAPHATEELWSSLGNKGSIHLSSWPVFDPKLVIDEENMIILQINGKVRGSFMAIATMHEEELKEHARSVPEAKRWLEGKEIQRMIVVPGKLVNIVVG